jgi:hypothetical protein
VQCVVWFSAALVLLKLWLHLCDALQLVYGYAYIGKRCKIAAIWSASTIAYFKIRAIHKLKTEGHSRMQETQNYVKCKRCGIAELSETLVNGVCEECLWADRRKELRRKSDEKFKEYCSSNYYTWLQFYRRVLLRDKILYSLSNICIPIACFLPVFFLDDIWQFLLMGIFIFIALEISYEVVIGKTYHTALLRFSEFEKNATSDAEREEIRIFSRIVMGVAGAIDKNPRNWTDRDIYDVSANEFGLGGVIFKGRKQERLFYLRWWYRNNEGEKNYDYLGVAVLRAANLYPSAFEKFVSNRKAVGYIYKVTIFLFFLFLSSLDYPFKV